MGQRNCFSSKFLKSHLYEVAFSKIELTLYSHVCIFHLFSCRYGYGYDLTPFSSHYARTWTFMSEWWRGSSRKSKECAEKAISLTQFYNV